MSLLIALAAIPPCAVQAYLDSGGEAALEKRFAGLAGTAQVQRYRFRIAGLGDTVEFWKIEGIDAEACQKIVAEHSLEVQSPDHVSYLGSALDAPRWWPRSARDFAVFEGDDGLGGSIEVWMPQKGKAVYLYRFIE